MFFKVPRTLVLGFSPGFEVLMMFLSAWLLYRCFSWSYHRLHSGLTAPDEGGGRPHQGSHCQPLRGLHRVLCHGQCWWDLPGGVHTLRERWVNCSLDMALFRTCLAISSWWPMLISASCAQAISEEALAKWRRNVKTSLPNRATCLFSAWHIGLVVWQLGWI